MYDMLPRWCIFSGFYLPSSLILRPSASCIETASILAQHFGAEVMVDPLLAREASKSLQGHVFFVLNPGFPQIFRKKLQLVLFILRWFFGNSWHAGLCSDVVWISGPCGWKNRPSDFEIGATVNRNHNKKMFEYCVDPPPGSLFAFFFSPLEWYRSWWLFAKKTFTRWLERALLWIGPRGSSPGNPRGWGNCGWEFLQKVGMPQQITSEPPGTS